MPLLHCVTESNRYVACVCDCCPTQMLQNACVAETFKVYSLLMLRVGDFYRNPITKLALSKHKCDWMIFIKSVHFETHSNNGVLSSGSFLATHSVTGRLAFDVRLGVFAVN